MLTYLLLVACPLLVLSQKHEVMLELRQGCEELYVNVDEYDQVDVKAFNNTALYSAPANTSCLAYFKTSNPGQGLCVRMHAVTMLSEHVRLEFQTGPISPVKIFQGRKSGERGYWCFPERVLAVRVSSEAFEQHVEKAVFFSFSVTNMSRDSMPRDLYMDSFAECGMTYTLTSGQEVSIRAERHPRVTSDLPDTCKLTFKTSSEDEFEQVCLKLAWVSLNPKRLEEAAPKDKKDKKPKPKEDLRKVFDEAQILQLHGLNPRFYTTYEALGSETVCSEEKELTIVVNRTKDVKTNFSGKISSRWHPSWEAEATEAKEMAALRVVKGITYFIATIDSLTAVIVAIIAAILKRPDGPWRRWAEHFNTHTASQAQQGGEIGSNYGSMHACKDGNYPELPAEGATHTSEVYVESHTY